ncbi:MAG: hypothetical protein ABSH00_05205 [Bryobacteraceae bacterium]|jgi:ferric-dicitrate binding protein FerR (iron transport regulator)
MSGHLSSVEISEWLAGIRASGAERHLAECAGCAAELERAREPLARFGAAARAWCAAETPAPRLEPIESELRRRRRFTGVGIALAAAAALMVAAPVYRQHQRALEMARQDEALLEQVQTEVSRSAPEPMQPLEKLVAWNSPSGQSGSSQ